MPRYQPIIENSETPNIKAQRERSPAFPFISLRNTIERLIEFENTFGRHPTPANKTGLAWDMKGYSSQAQQTTAALKYFGLVDYDGLGTSRSISITEDGRNYLRAQQETIKKELLKKFALKPAEIARFWNKWGDDRPIDDICLNELVLQNRYTESSAPLFLKVYDETIAFAELILSDKNDFIDEPEDTQKDIADIIAPKYVSKYSNTPISAASSERLVTKKGFSLLAEERILQDGILSQNATYRIIVSGKIGPKEIERLIKKLEVDKEILADSIEISEE